MADQEVSMFQKIWSLGNYHKLANEHQSISEHLVSEAGVRAGQKVLDLAAGSGNTTVAAARRRAHVIASDIVPEMLDVTRERVKVEQLQGVDYHVGNSVPTIDFPDATFDTVLSTLGASFFPDHPKVIDEVLRITRPGGTIGIALWSQASMPSDVFRAGRSVSESATAIDKIAPAYQLCNGEYLREVLKGRASAVRIVTGAYESCYETMDDCIEAHVKNHPPAILRLAAYSEEQRAQYGRMIADIAGRYNRAVDGTLAICMDYTLLIITKA